jgi:hypothetical protein
VGQSLFVKFLFGGLSLVFLASVALAHEGAQMDCNQTNIDAMTADIQAMPEGEAKTTAMTELQMAEDMMANKDMKACKAHLYNAMEATEK